MPLDPQSLPGAPLTTYDEIRRAALLRIQRYTPEWTDYNESDPGVTLVELFAWLTEMLLYEMKQVPDRNYLTFLRNLGFELQPPEPAVAQIAFTAQPNSAVAPVPPGAQLRAQPDDGGDPLVFEMIEGLSLVRPPLEVIQVFDGVAFQRIALPQGGGEISFRPFGWTPRPGSALYLGFNKPEGASPTSLFPQEMQFYVFLPPSQQVAQAVSCRDVPLGAVPPTPPASLVWEYRQGLPAALRWRQLAVYEDRSVAFTREGSIKVAGKPAGMVATKEGTYVDADRYWLRIRMDGGAFPAGAAPTIAALVPNVAAARNLATVKEEVLGTSAGTPNQVFTFARKPVYVPAGPELGGAQADEPQIRVEEPGETAIWERHADLLGSGPEDCHYTLAAVAGQIRFGDGRNGRIPGAGVPIVAQQYLYGGGSRGNVGAGLISNMITQITGVAGVNNPRPAVGGTNEQSIDDFVKCAPAQLRHRDRAVSVGDFEALALEVGGIARAKALPLYHPDHPGVEVPGCITVLIVPDTSDRPPEASQAQLEAVCGYLEPRRLLTTELKVSRPKFLPVRVEATVEAQPYAAFDRVEQQVLQALNDFLSPVPPKPAAGQTTTPPTGSDFGLDLHPTKLFERILSVKDVQAVDSLDLYVDGQIQPNLRDAVTVPDDTMLFSAGDHTIHVVPYQDR